MWFLQAQTCERWAVAPIAFWRNKDDQIVCCFEGKLVDPLEHWTFAAKYPVNEASYRRYIRNGHWPDIIAQSPRSNMPSDPFEALKLEVHDKLDQAQNWLKTAPKAPTETDANMARNMQAALLQLNKRADVMHKSEKLPHLDASRAVDTKFDFRKVVATVADRLRDVFTAFMRAEETRQRVEAQKRFRKNGRRPKRRERLRRRSEKGCKTRIPPSLLSVGRSPFLSFLSLQSRSKFKWAAASGARRD